MKVIKIVQVSGLGRVSDASISVPAIPGWCPALQSCAIHCLKVATLSLQFPDYEMRINVALRGSKTYFYHHTTHFLVNDTKNVIKTLNI